MLSNAKKILGFDDTLLSIVGIILNTSISMGIYFGGALFEVSFVPFVLRWTIQLIGISILWIMTRNFYIAIVKKYPGYTNRHRRWTLLPLLYLPFWALMLFSILYLRPLVAIKLPGYTDPFIGMEIVVGGIILLVDICIYESLHMYAELNEVKIKEERMEKERISSQLISLRNQISPHFLFNSLNTLVYLIDEDKEKGKEFVHKLSYIYKCILEASDKDLVSVKEEMEYINAYSELLSQRFGNNLNFNFQIEDNEQEKKIVSLALQVGIENAVKHNIISRKKPLTIDVISQNDCLIVRNNLQRKSNDMFNNGFGLKNIANRYKLLTNKKIEIVKGENDFILKIPLIKM
ncbi:histidine kinase [Muricauda sp. SCSIO 64092]|uniref:sensor histidine kinase n=1 Tax=Allomuricauda sp. SCSIO 64092 TaxID=2908842 RepID=UPI001FF6EC65|nr:histidine kinase [Muricauda sp. SCSIO 64092]UOY05276.1 histidine kinase [Muricauda sp. SCSIO 64092]